MFIEISTHNEMGVFYSLNCFIVASFIFCYKGYDNQDWFIPSPALEIDEADLKLSPGSDPRDVKLFSGVKTLLPWPPFLPDPKLFVA
ncbi:hypothetical protein NQ315_003690 [Exocentrus adspersus]|uniref:Uncharacterized protein n=1 Tax=Exocentrus adspersus TaxID=1586481 RepID=A0AAV8V9D6_9CUCU|nr:hypothetical protein NQ315_003690 [Exocentrus adspersus]